MGLVQHKHEAYWFYKWMSTIYDNYVNPFFWNTAMRSEAMQLAKLDRPDLKVIDVGAGTGFSTLGIIEKVQPQYVTMLDQSPDQLAKAKDKPDLHECQRVVGDAEELAFPTDYFDRYVSAGSIEYWPDPQRAIAEAYRVLKPGGIALIIGPLQRQNVVARWLSNLLMLFPSERDYIAWFQEAGFTEINKIYISPHWYEDNGNEFALAIAGVKSDTGEPAIKTELQENINSSMSFVRSVLFIYRFSVGSTIGVLFIFLAYFNALRAKIQNKITNSATKNI